MPDQIFQAFDQSKFHCELLSGMPEKYCSAQQDPLLIDNPKSHSLKPFKTFE